MTIAVVAPAVPTSTGEGLYDYRIPSRLVDLVRPGVRVAVPLLGRTVEGFCLAVKDTSAVPAHRLKPVSGVLDPRPAYPPQLLSLAVWAAQRYLCQPGEVLQAAIPAPGRFRSRTGEAVDAESEPSDAGGAPNAGSGGQTGRRRRRRADPEAGDAGDQAVAADEPAGGVVRVLTPAQRAALEAVKDALGRRTGRVFLLHGVTGSGKTEVFLRAAAESLAAGRQALLLVPEVSLVPQTVERVRAHLGSARVAVAHSYLGGRERLGYWERVVSGAADVVVGARSAVFAPLGRLGLIVLDEEHEDAYKQEERAPRYHAREVAAARAEGEGAVLILASATPALESYQRALTGRYQLLTLPERVAGRPMPPVKIVDMRAELRAGNRSPFSRTLQAELGRVLAAGRQAVLFLNRRGHSTFVLCRDCGWVARCSECDVSLTYHAPGADLLCHYCGHRAPAPDRCPACSGHRVRYFGAGTQKIEDEVGLLFPEARVVRLDADVVRRQGEAGRALALFAAGQADVLVGTQMVAKGLDLPGVALVAAVSADSALHLPDFRAPERTFRLLTQAAGRAGRGSEPGQVIIQTYNPEHPAVVTASTHDYRGFARVEAEARRQLGYPPWSHLIRVEFTDPDEGAARSAAEGFTKGLAAAGFDPTCVSPAAGGQPQARFAGPAPAPLARLRGRYRWHALVFVPELSTGLDAVRRVVLETTGRPARGGRRKRPQGPSVAVDVDPVSVL